MSRVRCHTVLAIALLSLATFVIMGPLQYQLPTGWLLTEPANDRSLAAASLHRSDGLGNAIAPPPTTTRMPLSSAVNDRNFTVVTAYFNLGSFQKGSETATRGPIVYFNWMWPYRFMRNAVVAFFDDAAFAAEFAEQRQGLPTEIVMVNRSDTWAFSLHNRTQSVFAQPDYPKKHPKSTEAAYACAMHAKYELLARAAIKNPFGSTYFAWMDIGIYRTLPSEAKGEFFTLRAPRCHRDDSVMFALIFPAGAEHTVVSVMRDGTDWVGGGFFLARGDVMQRFFDDYRKHATAYLSAGLANHDQSVIMAMYLPETRPRPVVPLQAVVPTGNDDPWFQLPLRLRRDGLENATGGGAASALKHSCSYELYD